MKKNDIVTIKPEWRELGEKYELYLVLEEPSEFGAVQVKSLESNLPIVPINLVHIRTLEPTGMDVGQCLREGV